MTSVWLCLYCFYIYKRFSNGGIIKDHHLKVKYFNIAAYDIPTFFTLVSNPPLNFHRRVSFSNDHSEYVYIL